MVSVAFLCTGPNRKYVILLKAVNSNGNGPDIQTEVQTSDSKGIYTYQKKEINWVTYHVALKYVQQEIVRTRHCKCVAKQ